MHANDGKKIGLKLCLKCSTSLINPILTTIKNQIDKVDKKLLKLIDDCPEYHAKNDILQSVPGIGNVVAFSLLADMPELGNISSKQAAALIGVAPFIIEKVAPIKDNEEFVEDVIRYVL